MDSGALGFLRVTRHASTSTCLGTVNGLQYGNLHVFAGEIEWPLDLDLNESASGPPLGRLPQVVFVVCPASPNT